MTMKMVAHVAAVLGYAMPETEMDRCGDLAAKLYEADLKLLKLEHEDAVSGVDHTEETNRIIDEAGKLVTAVTKGRFDLYFNDELPRDPLDRSVIGGRLKLVWTGSPWNVDNPLYFALPHELGLGAAVAAAI